MKAYNVYHDSGIEWLGEIPSSWKVKSLKFLAEVIPSNIDKKSVDGEKQVKLCNYVDVYKNDFITCGIEFMEATASDIQIARLTIQEGDVIATKDSEDPNDIAVPALVKEDFEDVVCGYHLTLMRPNQKELHGGFLFWLLNSKGCNQFFSTQAKGVTRYAVGISAFKNLATPVPPIEEQTQIAKFLDHKTSQIDKLIADKEKLIELLNEERTAIINQAVTKGLNPGVPMKDSGIEWLGEVPEHWAVKKLKFVFECLNTIRVPLNAEERGIMTDKVYDYYGASGVIDKVEKYLFDEELILIGEDGANLLTRSKRLAFIAKGKYWVNNHAHILKPNNGNIQYLCELLELIDYSVYVSGSAQPKLTQEALLSIEIVEPPLNEQNQISEFLHQELTGIETIILKIRQEIELLKEYKTALISEVVTGKVDVRDEIIPEPTELVS